MTAKRLTAFLDRVEADTAVLLVGGGSVAVDFPAACLPEGAVEGTRVTITIEVDSEATQEATSHLESQITNLEAGD